MRQPTKEQNWIPEYIAHHSLFITPDIRNFKRKAKKRHPEIQCLSNCCPFAFSSTNPSPAGPAAKHRAGPNLWVGERKYFKSLSSSRSIRWRLSPQVLSISQILLFSLITTWAWEATIAKVDSWLEWLDHFQFNLNSEKSKGKKRSYHQWFAT